MTAEGKSVQIYTCTWKNGPKCSLNSFWPKFVLLHHQICSVRNSDWNQTPTDFQTRSESKNGRSWNEKNEELGSVSFSHPNHPDKSNVGARSELDVLAVQSASELKKTASVENSVILCWTIDHNIVTFISLWAIIDAYFRYSLLLIWNCNLIKCLQRLRQLEMVVIYKLT